MKRGNPGDERVVVDVFIEAGDWQRCLPSSEDICRRAAKQAFAAAAGEQPVGAVEACVVLADDRMVQQLNGRFRGIDRPTNVLSFPAAAEKSGATTEPRALGDIVVAFETASAEAAATGTPLADHLSHLVVHAMLHLLGHDHEIESEAEAMERLEVEILAALGVPDPYSGDGIGQD